MNKILWLNHLKIRTAILAFVTTICYLQFFKEIYFVWKIQR